MALSTRPDAARLRRQELGDAEIEELGAAGGVDEDVRRLEIPVHHQAPVGVVDRLAHLDHQAQPLLQREAAGGAPVGDRSAVDVLEDEVGLAALAAAAVEEARDAGMHEAGEDPALAQEPGQDRLRSQLGPHQLERDAAVELAVGPLGEPDLGHAAAAEEREQPVVADPLAGAVGRGRRPRPRRARPRRTRAPARPAAR